jgi:hypothetical protein
MLVPSLRGSLTWQSSLETLHYRCCECISSHGRNSEDLRSSLAWRILQLLPCHMHRGSTAWESLVSGICAAFPLIVIDRDTSLSVDSSYKLVRGLNQVFMSKSTSMGIRDYVSAFMAVQVRRLICFVPLCQIVQFGASTTRYLTWELSMAPTHMLVRGKGRPLQHLTPLIKPSLRACW